MPQGLRESYRNANEILLLEKQAYARFSVHEVKDLPQYYFCNWLPPYFKDKDGRLIKKEDVQKRAPRCCFNHAVGRPKQKFQDESEGPEMDLYGYQQRILEKYLSTHYYAQNKTRGAGTTELKVVRWDPFWYGCIVKNIGRKCLVLAGINEDLAMSFLGRVKMLCDNIPEIYLFPPKSDTPSEIFFAQGGSLWALPAKANAVRGLENVGDVDYDESAHWSRVDDTPVLKAGEPHVTKSRARVNHFSTPQGKQKFFWDKIFDPECNPPTKYMKHTLNWREVVGVPEPDPDVLSDIDFDKGGTREAVDKVYLKRYEKDKEYKQWFNQMFPGCTIKQILDVKMPIIDINEIRNLYKTDRSTYDQELDNQFILTENKAFAQIMETPEVKPDNFERIILQK